MSTKPQNYQRSLSHGHFLKMAKRHPLRLFNWLYLERLLATELLVCTNSISPLPVKDSRAWVGGHRVCDQALCPASMYLECVTMGLSLIGQEVDSQCLRFENISFEAPLGTQPKGEVLLTLTFANQDGSFQFTVRSVTPQQTSQHSICIAVVVLYCLALQT